MLLLLLLLLFCWYVVVVAVVLFLFLLASLSTRLHGLSRMVQASNRGRVVSRTSNMVV